LSEIAFGILQILEALLPASALAFLPSCRTSRIPVSEASGVFIRIKQELSGLPIALNSIVLSHRNHCRFQQMLTSATLAAGAVNPFDRGEDLARSFVVTHGVNIAALTGIQAAQGEIVVVGAEPGGKVRAIDRISAP
jgi:hypothetical protein